MPRTYDELLAALLGPLDRQGPGSDEMTRNALNHVPLDRSKHLKVADLGCGTGASTFVLAEHLQGEIIAVDLIPEFLDLLLQRASTKQLQATINPTSDSMLELPIAKNSLDLIWSEGSINHVGFEAGIRYWHQLLKPGGFMVVSELTWLDNDPPEEIASYWEKGYPTMTNVDSNIDMLETAGFEILHVDFLPKSCWTTNYYEPIEAAIHDFVMNHEEEEVYDIVKEFRDEMQMYDWYGHLYNYGVYIVRKIN